MRRSEKEKRDREWIKKEKERVKEEGEKGERRTRHGYRSHLQAVFAQRYAKPVTT